MLFHPLCGHQQINNRKAVRKIVYYVATSLDGFISGPNEDISDFVGSGNGVEKYLSDLQQFDTVIMGRKTYEFGYKFGLKPGQPAYPHMKHYVFSETLSFNNADKKVTVLPLNLENIESIQRADGSDIYLCGGGQLAGWLLQYRKIDILKIKLNPLILGDGTRIFGDTQVNVTLDLTDTERYDNGLQLMTYQVIYAKENGQAELD
jgi:dihydrofolate reductase